MRNLASILLAIIVTGATASTAAAQPVARNTFGVDAALVLPLDDYGRVATIGGGVLGRFEFPAGSGFVTARAGVLLHAVKDDVASFTLIPIYAGYRLPIGPSGLYVAGELGLTLGYASVDTQVGSASDSDTELGLTLGAGVKRGALDFRAALFLPDADDLIGLLGTVGYDFAAF